MSRKEIKYFSGINIKKQKGKNMKNYSSVKKNTMIQCKYKGHSILTATDKSNILLRSGQN